MGDAIDEAFMGLPLERLAAAALSRARQHGAADASVHVVRSRSGRLTMHDGASPGWTDGTETALGVRLVHDGTWGYAATFELTNDAAARAVDEAVAVATACRPLRRAPVVLAPEPVYPGATWASSCQVNPFDVTAAERTALLADWSSRLLAGPGVEHVRAELAIFRENRFYADAAGTTTTQQRTRVHPMVTAFGTGPSGVASMRTSAPPTGRGWEYLSGTGWDWERELSELPGHLAGKSRARPVEPRCYDLIIDPSNLWLTIHETIGHSTELDRALGYEASYAGTTFVSPGSPGTLHVGSELMNVSADRTAEHGLATVGFDDEGVAAQSWPIVRQGALVGLQTDRHTAAMTGAVRSAGCAYAESALYPPLSRMPNVSLHPAVDGPATEDLISAVEDGIYVAGAASWSIDSQREHFQFTAQRCHRVRSGRLRGQLAEVAYQGATTEFWRALTALGGAASYKLFGADLCGKGQPLQISAASHGCPAAVFRGIRVVRAGAPRS